MKEMTSKLIVIDGMDSSGKATQTELLIKRLNENNIQTEKADFPQYNNPSSIFVQKYLNGEFGEAHEVNPQTASLFYALDRYAAAKQLKIWLSNNKTIIANRYTPANQAYQGSKINDKSERTKFLQWLDNIEHNTLGIPRPTKVIFLHVPVETSQKLMETRDQKLYIKEGKKDIHEKNVEFLKSTEQVYLDLAKTNGWSIIECIKNGKLLSKEEIHELVWKEVN